MGDRHLSHCYSLSLIIVVLTRKKLVRRYGGAISAVHYLYFPDLSVLLCTKRMCGVS